MKQKFILLMFLKEVYFQAKYFFTMSELTGFNRSFLSMFVRIRTIPEKVFFIKYGLS